MHFEKFSEIVKRISILVNITMMTFSGKYCYYDPLSHLNGKLYLAHSPIVYWYMQKRTAKNRSLPFRKHTMITKKKQQQN